MIFENDEGGCPGAFYARQFRFALAAADGQPAVLWQAESLARLAGLVGRQLPGRRRVVAGLFQ